MYVLYDFKYANQKFQNVWFWVFVINERILNSLKIAYHSNRWKKADSIAIYITAPFSFYIAFCF